MFRCLDALKDRSTGTRAGRADLDQTWFATFRLRDQDEQLNPAQLRRDITALLDQLLTLVRAKHPAARIPVKTPTATRAATREATKTRTRAS